MLLVIVGWYIRDRPTRNHVGLHRACYWVIKRQLLLPFQDSLDMMTVFPVAVVLLSTPMNIADVALAAVFTN